MPPRNTVGDYVLRANAIALVRITEPAPPHDREKPWSGPSPVAAGEVVKVLKAPEGQGPPGWPEKAEWSFVAPTWPALQKGVLALVFLEQPPGSTRWNSSQTDKDQIEIAEGWTDEHPWFQAIRIYLEIEAFPAEPAEAHNRAVKERLLTLMDSSVPRIRRDALEEALRFNEFWKLLSDEDVSRLIAHVENRSLDGPFRFRMGVVLHLLHDRIPHEKSLQMLRESDAPPLTAALLKLAGTCTRPECGEAVLPFVDDPDANVRLTAIAQAARFPSPAAAKALLARLSKEESYYYKKDIVDALLEIASPEALAGLVSHFETVPDTDKLKRHYERRLRRVTAEGRISEAAPKSITGTSGSEAGWAWPTLGGIVLLALAVVGILIRKRRAR